MKWKITLTKKDGLVALGCVLFVMANLGAVGTAGRRRAKEAVCLSNLYKWGVIWKSLVDDNDGYFPDSSAMMYWPPTTWPYCGYPALWFCPEATILYTEGGRPPFSAWSTGEPTYASSYCINLWVSNEANEKFWRTPYVSKATYVPILLDGNWRDAEPEPYDEVPPYDGYWWEPNANEMKRVCINRHRGAVNCVFLDLSAQKIGLKRLWKLEWQRNWPEDAFPDGGWFGWMENFKDF